jgi:hypothetical protein
MPCFLGMLFFKTAGLNFGPGRLILQSGNFVFELLDLRSHLIYKPGLLIDDTQ